MKYILLFTTIVTIAGCSPRNTPHSPDDTGSSSGTPNVAPSNSNDSRSEETSKSENAAEKHTAKDIVGNWKHGDNIRAIYLVLNTDGTFSTRDWDALSGRGEVRTSEGVWTAIGNSVSLTEKTFDGNTSAGGQQKRDMKGTLTGSVLKLNDLEFTRKN